MTITLDTYLPTVLGENLAKLNLKGLKVAKIESPSVIYGARKIEDLETDGRQFKTYHKDATVDLETILTFENNRKISFIFSSASHVCIHELKSDYEMDYIGYSPNSVPISDIFSDIIGKTIVDFKIHTSKDTSFDFEDAGFDENQEEYIEAFELIFNDNSRLGFKCDIDFMLIYYDA